MGVGARVSGYAAVGEQGLPHKSTMKYILIGGSTGGMNVVTYDPENLAIRCRRGTIQSVVGVSGVAGGYAPQLPTASPLCTI